ncbi:hypothetical protein PsYK624_147210 [Phanerochaete sordida]|uniref:SnoaL-like domain-containing protein n=1 Tax=Phanerochaete sordida TaxID=48140 RepID=A0A9P3GQH0_9APHY|nr:hypothetical protein PsYK624_147210 [Phanerochaete sordida]
MSTEPVFLTLANWAELRLQSVFTARDQEAFDNAFDALVAPHAVITVNGTKTSRAEYKTLLRSEEQNESSGDVAFKGTVEVVKNGKALVPTGDVGVFFEATIRYQLALWSNIVTASMNLVVENVDGEPEFDSRKATKINQVFTYLQSNIQ